jgi:hypothetical protein
MKASFFCWPRNFFITRPGMGRGGRRDDDFFNLPPEVAGIYSKWGRRHIRNLAISLAETGVKIIAGELAPLLGVIKFTLPVRDLYQVIYDVSSVR